MSEKKTLGGDRLGSGKGMKFQLPNFERSTHDIGKVWKSSMTVGTLVPVFNEIGLNGDTFSFNTEALIRTIPTNAPLLGTFKFQLDFFSIPMRLYNGLTHSNAINIGLDISDVMFPKMELLSTCLNPDKYADNINTSQLSSSCLHNYLGLKGIGMFDFTDEDRTTVYKKFQCIPHLGYYDIYKNYYANKQENVGKIVTANIDETEVDLVRAYQITENNVNWVECRTSTNPAGVTIPNGYKFEFFWFNTYDYENFADSRTLQASNDKPIQLEFDGKVDISTIRLFKKTSEAATATYVEVPSTAFKCVTNDNTNNVFVYATGTKKIGVTGVMFSNFIDETATPEILTFPLENIDKMKFAILRDVGLGNEFIVNNENLEPYQTLHTQTGQGYQKSKYPLVGLALKTYQSDIFNNLMSTATINQVKAATNVAVTNGQFSLDSLFLANKTMKMLTAIAVAGGTYQDWQQAVYGDSPTTYEIPMYHGSMSAEIGFEEVVSTAEVTTARGDQPLGTLAGKGKILNKKGGNIEIKVNEPSFIMAIASITPRIDYSQGNKFYFMDDFQTFDDLHKPQLDGIAYQDVPTETMAWWSRMKLTEDGNYVTYSAGKTPAWMFYMTNYDEVHGDFMAGETLDLMVLNRKYELNRNLGEAQPRRTTPIEDLTTYIDPVKYNYAFADGKITAQNFWVQIAVDCQLRRKISAKIIPTM